MNIGESINISNPPQGMEGEAEVYMFLETNMFYLQPNVGTFHFKIVGDCPISQGLTIMGGSYTYDRTIKLVTRTE